MGATKSQGVRKRADTSVALQALTAADHGRKVSLGAGLTGRVHAAADGTIGVHVSWRYRIEGRLREIRIGTWRHKTDAGSLSLKAIRDRRDRYATALRAGHDPIEQGRAAKLKAKADIEAAAVAERRRLDQLAEMEAAASRRITIRKLFEQWQRAELTPHSLADGTRTGRKDGGEWVRQSFERRVFSSLGDRAVEDVRRSDLLRILDEAKAEGRRRTANVLLTDLRQMFRFAAEREIVSVNPLAGIKREKVGGKDVERDRVLDDDEIRALARALPNARMTPRSELAVWLILGTACRLGEAMGARWEHIDLGRRRWYLPETKNERDHTIHLSDFARAQFQALAHLREVCDDGKLSPWVFPATDPASPVCVKSFGKQLADRQREPEKRMSNRTKAVQALALAGGRWTAHDLRRTAATIMARLSISSDVIDECLNHKLQSRVARVYIRDRREADQARAFDALGAYLQCIAVGREDDQSNVVPMPVRAA